MDGGAKGVVESAPFLGQPLLFGEVSWADGDEEAFGSGEDGAVGALKFGLVEEFAVGGAVWFGCAA